jgi:hypothetical protein
MVNEIRSLLRTLSSNLQSWKGKEIVKFMPGDLVTSKLSIRLLEDPDLGLVQQFGPFHANLRVIEAVSGIKNELLFHIPLSKVFPAIDGVFVLPVVSSVRMVGSEWASAARLSISMLTLACKVRLMLLNILSW